MHINHIRIKNFKSIQDSREVFLTPGINIFTGKNNSGKTSILEALNMTKESSVFHTHGITSYTENAVKKFRSSQAKAEAEIEIYLCIEFDTNEFYRYGKSELEEFIDKEINNRGIKADFDSIEVIKKYLKQNKYLIGYKFETNLNEDTGRIYLRNVDLFINGKKTNFYNSTFEKGKLRYTWFKRGGYVTVGLDGCLISSSGEPPAINKFPFPLLADFLNRFFFISAHRFWSAENKPNMKEDNTLDTNASNLKTVLQTLSNNNPEKFEKLEALIKKVFPDITGIITKIEGSATDIYFSHATAGNIPVSMSGTGIGQFLSLVVPVVTSEDNHLFLIDEPHSFLHPEAEKKLIAFMNGYSDNQYLIATHSPILINAAKLRAIHFLIKENGMTKIKTIDTNSSEQLSFMLDALGIKPADLFFYDKIIWVEGATELKVFPLILEHLGFKQSDNNYNILPIKNTDDLVTKNKKLRKQTLSVYKKVINNVSKIALNYLFVFDSDEKTKQEIEDIKREFDQKVFFLPRREIENYFLIPRIIYLVLTEEMEKIGIDRALTEEDLTEKFEQQKNNIDLYPDQTQIPENWRECIKGSDMLEKLFWETAKIEYQKTTHGLLLAEKIKENYDSEFEELKERFANFLGDNN